jgi:hypothetical protein
VIFGKSDPELSLSSGRFGLIGLRTRPHQRPAGENSAQTPKTQAKTLNQAVLAGRLTNNVTLRLPGDNIANAMTNPASIRLFKMTPPCWHTRYIAAPSDRTPADAD